MARLTLTVSERQAGRTAGSLLKHELGLSTTCVNRLKRSETGLLLDGQRVFTNAVVRAGQVLEANLGEAERPSRITPIAMDLHILFEDEHLLVLDKPAPLAVIPSSLSPGEPTLANGLAHYLGEGFTFHPVNRLDRGTGGLTMDEYYASLQAACDKFAARFRRVEEEVTAQGKQMEDMSLTELDDIWNAIKHQP